VWLTNPPTVTYICFGSKSSNTPMAVGATSGNVHQFGKAAAHLGIERARCDMV